MLRDPRLRESFKKIRAEQLEILDGKLPRPELDGYSREVSELHKLHVTMTRVLRAVSKNNAIPLPEGPVFPGEEIDAELDTEYVDDLDGDIEAAMGRSVT
ncbi:hypothetical protein ORI20_14080 [Mycobacterium sp. CVI_P3]|uniref:Uncharacterized protein n=1 Tax=Mycobacterium pinniadriaticum TaxID=2994102 RepID=A0ABT3SE87_9MYCO|nr:hypothetical protein [Mycobacterium pinniadriaticum]MCX2931409.1 hypothetical protein [Mycobacterium pinniadriaticum]MCX2937833.1 hypothetical protein [Mycobacterium pinniadriaticum]